MTDRHLETQRLILRPFTPADGVALHAAVYSSAAVMRFLPGGVPRTLEQTDAVINHFIGHREQHGFGAWAIIQRADNRLIGQCGLNRLQVDGTVEVFYAISESCWGKGITSEAARAVVGDGFTTVGLDRIIALAVPENTPSRRVMEKLGMSYEGLTTTYYNGAQLALYNLTAASWHEQHSSG